jgi:hypothetical protein
VNRLPLKALPLCKGIRPSHLIYDIGTSANRCSLHLFSRTNVTLIFKHMGADACHDSFGFSVEVVTRCFLLLPGPFLKWCMIFWDCANLENCIYHCSLSTFTTLLAFLYFSRRLLATAHVRSITLPRDGVAATESDSHDSAGSGMSPLMSVMKARALIFSDL